MRKMRNIFLPLTRSAAFQKEPDCDGRNRRTSWTVGCSASSKVPYHVTGVHVSQVLQFYSSSKYSKYLKYLPAWRGPDAPKWWTPWWLGACWWGERSHSENIIFTIFDLFLKSICASTHLNWDICLDNPGIDGSPAMPCTMSNDIMYITYNILITYNM